MKRRITAITICMIFLFLLTACENKDEASNRTDSSNETNIQSTTIEDETDSEVIEITDSENNIYENLIYDVQNNHIKITGYINDPIEIIIPSKINGLPVTIIGDRAFEHCDNLESIIISDGVTEIEGSAFWDCHKLINIELPDSVTYIGNCAFAGCGKCEEIILPKGLIEISPSMFGKCYSLKKIEIPDKVTLIGDSAFHNCSNLENIKTLKKIHKVLLRYKKDDI